MRILEISVYLFSLCNNTMQKEFERVENILQKLPKEDLRQVRRILYGKETYDIQLSERCKQLSHRYKIELISCGFHSRDEELRNPRLVRVGLFQQKLPLALTDPSLKVKCAMYSLATDAIKVAARGGVKIFCLQQAWNMPYAFCDGEKMPWRDYAENAQTGPTTKIIQVLAEQYNMVIISSILEREDMCEDKIWNTAVIIDNHGKYLGKYRRNHIPVLENSNEPTYYCKGNTGHPVFETEFGKIAVSICYERHHPLNWLGFALNGAEIVFNPTAAAGESNETSWAIEGRSAACANGYFVCAVNRVGTEIYEHDFITSDGSIVAHKDSGHFFGSSYVAAPNGSRSEGLSRTKNGLLIAELDLNLCRQVRDCWGFQMCQKLDMYCNLLHYENISKFPKYTFMKMILNNEENESCPKDEKTSNIISDNE